MADNVTNIADTRELSQMTATAERHRQAISAALALTVAAIEAARLDGFTANFNIGPDARGAICVIHLCISKVF